MSVDSPNLGGLDAWAFEPRKVEKPWGYELIWADTEQYVGKVLFVKAGESLSLQFHRLKDESWLVQSGRAKLDLGSAGDAVLREEVIGPGASFHFRPGTVHRVTAIEDTTVRVVTRERLQEELGIDSWLAKFVLALADRFRELDQKLGGGKDGSAKK
jgi:mannose-6-phosphate isomerase-like protein (cupin superfamily)